MLNDDRFLQTKEQLIARYGESGKTAGERLQTWLAGDIPFAFPEMLSLHLAEQHLDLLHDAFFQELPFGTGGRRGKVGFGPNRMNHTTVAMTVQGHCNYLLQQYGVDQSQPLAVVVANDVRVFNDVSGIYHFLPEQHPLLGSSSRSFAKLACEIYAGNGIVAYIAEPDNDSTVMTSPELAFTIRKLGAVGGLNLSASHNMPDDNGLKLYDAYGSQPVAPNDQHLADSMQTATDIMRIDFAMAQQQNMVRAISADLHRDYIKIYQDLYQGSPKPDPDLTITYTPLCGCGMTSVTDVLTELGFPVASPPGEDKPDGSFATIPFLAPNPEVAQATQPARVYADSIGSGIVLSSDPDADRVGLEAKLQDGSWYHFDGNQIAAILGYYLMLDNAGPQRKGLVIETLVTTKILGRIVEEAGDSVIIDDLLVGFKYVAHVLKELENKSNYGHVNGSPQQFVLAAEESHGVIMSPAILDKDATPACMYLALLYQQLASKGETLLDYYAMILKEMGSFDSVNRSLMMVGSEGIKMRDNIMSSLRSAPPKELCGYTVTKLVDYWNEDTLQEGGFGPFVSKTDVLPRNVLQLHTDALIVTIRPSGTEPKLKFYCQLLPAAVKSDTQGIELLKEIRAHADQIACTVYNQLLEHIGQQLSAASLLLPDIIDLNNKQKFDNDTVPHLKDALQNNKFADLSALLAWLGEQCQAMTPGSDPLPALKAPISQLCKGWDSELSNSDLLIKLANWATR